MQALQRVRPYIAQSIEPEQQQPQLPGKGAAARDPAPERAGGAAYAGDGAAAAGGSDLAAAATADTLAVDGSGRGPQVLTMCKHTPRPRLGKGVMCILSRRWTCSL